MGIWVKFLRNQIFTRIWPLTWPRDLAHHAISLRVDVSKRPNYILYRYTTHKPGHFQQINDPLALGLYHSGHTLMIEWNIPKAAKFVKGKWCSWFHSSFFLSLFLFILLCFLSLFSSLYSVYVCIFCIYVFMSVCIWYTCIYIYIYMF